MTSLAALVLLVGILLALARTPVGSRIGRWLPIPLWCYVLPMLAVTMRWLPAGDPVYADITRWLLPPALALLLLGVDLPALARIGAPALAAGAIGAAGMAIAAVGAWWLMRAWLPPEGWQGAGALAATWIGGSANLLAIRALLGMPDALFAPLIVVDAVVAYTWMAWLVAVSGAQERVNAWLRARPLTLPDAPRHQPATRGVADDVLALGLALSLACLAWLIARRLPTSALVSSTQGWVILVVTAVALIASLAGRVRRLGASGSRLGYPCLYLVLAATGAQADLAALVAAPMWLAVGVGTVAAHGAILLAAARWWRLPLGLIATCSQACVGGAVSGPLVGAVYHQALAPVGLLLAMAGNAVGTYVGWGVALACRGLTGAS